MNDASQGAKQTAYRILVDTDSAMLVKASGKLWNTGWVKSDDNLVIYSGQQLKPFTKYFWRVDIADRKNNKSDKTYIASFETGMMKMENWRGAWISDNENTKLKPAPYFRNTFITIKKSSQPEPISLQPDCTNYQSMGRKLATTVWTRCIRVLTGVLYMLLTM